MPFAGADGQDTGQPGISACLPCRPFLCSVRLLYRTLPPFPSTGIFAQLLYHSLMFTMMVSFIVHIIQRHPQRHLPIVHLMAVGITGLQVCGSRMGFRTVG